MDKKLLDILVCPACKGPLIYRSEQAELWCLADKLAYSIESDIPIMLVDKARKLTLDEIDSCKSRS